MANQTNRQKKRLWDFEPVSKAKWEERIKEDLNGDDYKTRLYWNSAEGFTAAPFYAKDDLQNLKHDVKTTVLKSAEWTGCEPIYEPTVEEANKAIKKRRQKRTEAFFIRSKSTWKSGSLGGDMMGIQIQNQADFHRLLDGIDINNVAFTFDSGMTTPALVALMRNYSKPFSNVLFTFDPFSYTAKRGRLPAKEDKLKLIVNELAVQENMKSLCADGLFYRQAGATVIQELGLALATASEYLAMIETDDKSSAASSIFVRLAAGPLYFPEIAKFRAIRLLWDNLQNAYGMKNTSSLTIFAETSMSNKTVTDPHNNLIRTVTEAMAAVLGGADQLLIHPYDSLYSTPEDFSGRIARNIHHILRHESHLDKVADPSAGSYYIENLTDSIARESWEFFQTIENEGGILQSLKNGSIQDVVNKSRQERENAIRRGKKILIGTTWYANSEENLPEAVNPPSFTNSLTLTTYEFDAPDNNLIESLQSAFKEDASVGDVIHSMLRPQKVLYKAVEEFRYGSVFDEIRHRTKSFIKKTGIHPVVHLVPVGDQKRRNERALFSHNVLGCGGFKIDHPNGYNSIKEAAETVQAGPADIFVLCSSDQEYKNLVKPFCDAFSGQGVCVVAGNPADHEAKYRDAGIDLFIHDGIDIPAILLDIQNRVFLTEENYETP